MFVVVVDSPAVSVDVVVVDSPAVVEFPVEEVACFVVAGCFVVDHHYSLFLMISTTNKRKLRKYDSLKLTCLFENQENLKNIGRKFTNTQSVHLNHCTRNQLRLI